MKPAQTPRALFLLIATLLGTAVAGDPRPTVAVLAFAGPGVDATDLAAATSRFESELLATDSFRIVERRNIDRILSEQGFQQSGACGGTDCSVEIGQLLSVQSIFTGELSRTGQVWSLAVRRTDVESGQTRFSHVLDIEGDFGDVLRGGVPAMARYACGREKPENDHTILVARGTRLWPWWLGGSLLVGGVAAAVLLDDGSSGARTTRVGLVW